MTADLPKRGFVSEPHYLRSPDEGDELLQILQEQIEDSLREATESGDVQAANLLLDRVVGKPDHPVQADEF